MSQENFDTKTLIIAGLNLYPPSIQNEVISDPDINDILGFTSGAIVTFSKGGLSFERSKLHDAARKVLSGRGEHATIKDQSGENWDVTVELYDGYQCVNLNKNSQNLLLDTFWPLIPATKERISRFEDEVQKSQFPIGSINYWQAKLQTPLLEDEITELQNDLEDTPYRVFKKLKQEMNTGSSSLTSLVPQDTRYYERLVGKHESSCNIIEYSCTEATNLSKELFSFSCYSGLSSLLLMCSHHSIAQSLEEMDFDKDELIKLYNWLAIYGDPISQIGAIELGLILLDRFPFLDSKIEVLVGQLLDRNSEEQGSKYNLLSSLIIMVDGEISRLQIFRDKPPFYRRLASIAQASLIMPPQKNLWVVSGTGKAPSV